MYKWAIWWSTLLGSYKIFFLQILLLITLTSTLQNWKIDICKVVHSWKNPYKSNDKKVFLQKKPLFFTNNRKFKQRTTLPESETPLKVCSNLKEYWLLTNLCSGLCFLLKGKQPMSIQNLMVLIIKYITLPFWLMESSNSPLLPESHMFLRFLAQNPGILYTGSPYCFFW